MGLGINGLVVRLIKFVLIPMLTVFVFYRNRKQKLLVDRELLVRIAMSAVVNVLITTVITKIAVKLARRFTGIELPNNRFFVVAGTVIAVFVVPKFLELFLRVSEKYFHMKEREVVKETLDHFFLLVIAVVCFGTQIGLTTFYFNLPYELYRKLYLATCLAAMFKVVLTLADNGSEGNVTPSKTNEFIKQTIGNNKEILLSLPVAAVFYLAFPSEHYLYQQFLAPLIIGCVGIRIRKVFIAAFVPSTLVIVVMMLASLSGAINSMASAGRNIRSYWGHISPTDFGTAVLMIVCFIWILFKDLPEEFFVIPAAFSLFISFYVTRCTTSGYLTVLLIVMFFCRAFGRRIVEKKGKFKWAQKLTDIAMLLVFPALGVLVLAMVYAYFKEMSFAGTLDTIFHKRLSPAAAMLAEHGLKPFGTYFDMFGYGGSTISSGNPYTFIDSSYPQILIRYGFVTYILANVMWVYTTWKALKTGNRRVAYVMTLLAMDFVMEHHWYELSYNVFILIPFAEFIGSTIEKESIFEKAIMDFKERWRDKKYALAFTVMSLCQLLVIFLLLPTAFSWLRTIINGYGLYGGGKKVFAAFTLIFIIVIIFIWNLSSLVAGMISEKNIRKINAVIFTSAGVIGLVSLMLGNVLINRVVSENKVRIEEERDLIELITSRTSGKVYADKLPEAYIRTINGISRSYFCGEDYARYDNATVITEASWDSQCLDARGFLYMQLSEEDAIYTNDDSVVEVLKENAYKLKGYNSYENKVDLKALAEMNDVETLENGGMLLKGQEHQLIHGPYLAIYSGRFAAKFEMKLREGGFSRDDKICTIRIAAYSGEQVKATIDLYRRDFDDEGMLDYEVPFSGGGQNFEFLVFTEEGVELEIDSVSYRRSPEYDAHEKTDSKGRVIRAEYYDLEGNPYEISKGYYGCEYAYNDKDLPIMQRYLGRDFGPVLTKDGYAEVHREYNLNKEITNVSYYGVDGEAIELPDGYHSVEREYDFSKNLVSECYYDLEGKPTLWNNAYFKYIKSFNEDNRWIRIEYYDTDKNLILQKEGYAIVERDYDEAGNVTEQRYYGIQNEPVLYNERYHKYRDEFNEKKQCIKELYYGTDGEPILQSGGYYGYERSYDDAGNVIRNMYLGADEKPVITDWGYACWHRSYNSKKQIIREEYYDTDEKRILLGSGISAVEYERDSKGNAVGEKYFGTDDEAVLNTSSIAEVEREFNDLNQKISEEYFDLDGKRTLSTSGISRREYDYDSSGNCVMDCFYGVDNERVLVSGYWKVIRTYNENRKNIHEEYFGTDGNPVLISEKYAMVDFSYDENGKLIKKTFRDMDGNVVEEQIVE